MPYFHSITGYITKHQNWQNLQTNSITSNPSSLITCARYLYKNESSDVHPHFYIIRGAVYRFPVKTKKSWIRTASGFLEALVLPLSLKPRAYVNGGEEERTMRWRGGGAGLDLLGGRPRPHPRRMRRARWRRHRRRRLPPDPVRSSRRALWISPRRPQPPRQGLPLRSRRRSLPHRRHDAHPGAQSHLPPG